MPSYSILAALAALVVAMPLAAQQRSGRVAAAAAASDSFSISASCTSGEPEGRAFAFDDFDAACLARLDRAATRCATRATWRVDFRGDGQRPRLVEWRRCAAPRAGDVVDYVLVRRGPTRNSPVQYAFDNSAAPGYSSIARVSPIALERRGDRRGLYVVSRLSGTGGYLEECLLGPRGADGTTLGCWPLPNIGPAILGQLREGETTGSRDAGLWRVDPAGGLTYLQVVRPEHFAEGPDMLVRVDVRLRDGRYVVTRASRHRQGQDGTPE